MTRDDEDLKRSLVAALWGKDADYYDRARAHVLEAAFSGGEYRWIREQLPPGGRVLEIGCGEGTNMEVLAAEGLLWFGCDLSLLAVTRAREKRPGGTRPAVVIADAERLPFEIRSFRAVLLVSVVEHLPRPEAVLEAAAEQLAPGGRLVVVSPQYGGPLGASPCRRGGGLARFVRRLLAAHLPARGGDRLGWDRVHPKVLEGAAYDGDMDTVVEPELRSLCRFLSRRGLRIRSATSGLEWHTWRKGRMSTGQRLARAVFEPLGRLGIAPYRSFGPLVAVSAERPSATPIP